MEYINLQFPKYDGLESVHEHNVYVYLENLMNEIGYFFMVKKTNFDNIDSNIIGKKGGRGACDAYVLDEYNGEALLCLLELETSGKINKGIEQIEKYIENLRISLANKSYKSKKKWLYGIVFDGEEFYLGKYFLNSSSKEIMIDKENLTPKDIKKIFVEKFPKKNKVKNTVIKEEKQIIREIKEIIKGNKLIQAHKIYLLTFLTAIYEAVKEENWEEAINKLERDATNDIDETRDIMNNWNSLSKAIEYKDKNEVKECVTRLYKNVIVDLFELSQFKHIDLYGFIYEELSEKNLKKEDGEYYTPRKHIRAIIESTYLKYLKEKWFNNNNKNKNQIDILKNKNIFDPFCGSGGFLYEYLKLLDKYFRDEEFILNEICEKAVYGADKNDPIAAYFNLYLIGDGRTNLQKVTTTLNWKNYWSLRLEKKNNKYLAVKITSDEELERNIDNNRKTLIFFLKMLLDIEALKKLFRVQFKYTFNTVEEFIGLSILKNNKKDFFYNLIDYKDKNALMILIYDSFLKIAQSKNEVPTFEEFKNSLGNVDYLGTNVPYGNVEDARFILVEGKNKLESNALIECIDFLRPSTYKVGNYYTEGDEKIFCEDENGSHYKSNKDGGVANIIIPNGILERDEREIREYLFKKCEILSIIKLPINTFAPYAKVQTFVLTIRKKALFEFNTVKQMQKTFFYIVDNDGKSNSEKRFDTMLISDKATNIKSNNTVVHEYLHDELAINIERYPEGYLSKLERAWIFGNKDNFDKNWNQQRYLSEWDGNEWKKIQNTKLKWANEFLKEKQYIKMVPIKNKEIKEAIKIINSKDSNFYYDDITIKREKIITYFAKKYLDNLTELKCDKKNNIVALGKGSKNKNFKAVLESIEKTKIYTEIGRDELISIILEKDKKYINYFDIINQIIDINIDDFNDVEFYKEEKYTEFVLTPEFYLKKDESFFSNSEIKSILSRMNNFFGGNQ